MNKFTLEMLTPEKTFFKGEVNSVIIQSPDGCMGVLAGHCPMVVGLEPAVITVKSGEEEKVCANGEGFMVVRPEAAIIMCQTLEWPEEIELNRVKSAIEENERRLSEARSIAEYKLSRAALARAFARLKVKIK